MVIYWTKPPIEDVADPKFNGGGREWRPLLRQGEAL